MALVHRIVLSHALAALLAFLILGAASSAFAQGTVPAVGRWTTGNWAPSCVNNPGCTAAQLASAAASFCSGSTSAIFGFNAGSFTGVRKWRNGSTDTDAPVNGQSPTLFCETTSLGLASVGAPTYWNNSGSTCPANSGNLSGGSCTCSSGFTASNGQCVTACTSGTQNSGYIPATASASTVCFSGCQANVQAARNTYSVGGSQVIVGTWIGNGTACAGQVAATSGAPPANTTTACASGTCPGTVNGVTICAPCTQSNPEKSWTQDTSTTTSPTGTTTPGATTSKETTCTGDSCTVKTTTTNPDGSSSTTTAAVNRDDPTKKNEVKAFCEENPTASICIKSSISGTCGAVTCTGDAVQCAMAREQAARNCQLMDTATTLSTLGNSLATGADPDAANLPQAAGKRTDTALSNAIDQSSAWGGSGACSLQDIQFSFHGHSFGYPISTWCTPLVILGQILFAVSLIVAGRIALGG